jgi:broad specificity phosphatase PhoE
MLRLVRVVVAAAVVAAVVAAPSAAELGERELVEALRRGGYVLYLRHAHTDWSQKDVYPVNFSACRTQRNLKTLGRVEARRIGRAVRTLGLPIGRVLVSPFCRTRDTARLAFGRGTVDPDLKNLPEARTDAERRRRVRALRRLLGAPPPRGRNTVIVAHMHNLEDAANVTIDEGEIAVFRPLGVRFRLVARIPSARWTALISATD